MLKTARWWILMLYDCTELTVLIDLEGYAHLSHKVDDVITKCTRKVYKYKGGRYIHFRGSKLPLY